MDNLQIDERHQIYRLFIESTQITQTLINDLIQKNGRKCEYRTCNDG